MNVRNIDWKKQTISFEHNLKDALQQHHHAAQYIALVGKYLIPQESDDSNTNMQYQIKTKLLVGNEFSNGLHVALHCTEMKLLLLNNANKALYTLDLPGKTKNEVLIDFKKILQAENVDISKLKNELHYEIPIHDLDNGAKFNVKDKKYFEENAIYRHNAEIILNEIATGLKNADPIRIWPHHFDTGLFYPVSYNEKGELSKSIGIGWAIPDTMVNEPYYYLSFWSEHPIVGIDKIVALEAGDWMMPVWNGAVLKNSDIINAGSAENQYELVKSFYKSGLKLLKNYLNF